VAAVALGAQLDLAAGAQESKDEQRLAGRGGSPSRWRFRPPHRSLLTLRHEDRGAAYSSGAKTGEHGFGVAKRSGLDRHAHRDARNELEELLAVASRQVRD
jgi:hypothetical protein